MGVIMGTAVAVSVVEPRVRRLGSRARRGAPPAWIEVDARRLDGLDLVVPLVAGGIARRLVAPGLHRPSDRATAQSRYSVTRRVYPSH